MGILDAPPPDRVVKCDTTSTYSYVGAAPKGTADNAAGWKITRITFAAPITIQTATGSWTNRATLTYA